MIVEFTLQQPTLLRTLQKAPSARISVEQRGTTSRGEELILFRVETDDLAAFETAMSDDPTVTVRRTLERVGDRGLFQVERVDAGETPSVYAAIVEVGGIVDRCVATHDGWSYRIAFPDVESLSHIHDVCADGDLSFTLHRKVDPVGGSGRADRYGVTEKQYEMLTRAVEEGYFEIPRRTTLETLASEMGISHQAASERLRRAIHKLVGRTMLSDRDWHPSVPR